MADLIAKLAQSRDVPDSQHAASGSFRNPSSTSAARLSGRADSLAPLEMHAWDPGAAPPTSSGMSSSVAPGEDPEAGLERERSADRSKSSGNGTGGQGSTSPEEFVVLESLPPSPIKRIGLDERKTEVDVGQRCGCVPAEHCAITLSREREREKEREREVDSRPDDLQ